MATQHALSPAQVKARLRAQGVTITQWAENHGYPRTAVYRVLNGVDKAAFGRAHEIAVDLGLKADPESEEPQRAAA